MPLPELYENKILRDEELPIQLNVSCRPQPASLFPSHWHEHIELHYVEQGTADVMLNQQQFSVGPGAFFIANSNELHSGVCTGGPYYSYVIIFDIADLSPELAKTNPLFRNLTYGDDYARDLIRRIFRELEGERTGYKQICRALVLELLVHLCREHVAQTLPERDSLKRKKDLERLNAVLCYIEEHYTERITNAQLAEMVCLSEDRFGHLFRDGVGRPPLQYINEMRLKKAMSLLRAGKYTVTEVADAVGFRDYNHFGRLFRRQYSCTPYEVKSGRISGAASQDSGIV